MAQLFRRFRWLYKKLRLRRLRYGIPLSVLAAYTVLGAYIFRHFELEIDEQRRLKYRENTEYAFNQVLARMMEVRCEDQLLREDHNLQARHTKDALFWLIDYLNLTQVIEERSESSPWTWIGSMFYAGQLYTTIGYGLPACQTDGGRIATMAYIMVGIPIFLLILAEVGKWLSRALRKFYKRLRNAQQKLPEVEDMARKMSEPVKAIYSLTPSLLSNGGSSKQKESTEADNTDLESGDLTKQKLASELAELEPEKQNELNEKIQKKSGSFPIPMALAILILWILLSAGMFCIWETEWGYLTSVYFFFVSISTVGLGDMIPTKPDMMLVNFMLILVGLALLSMCINLIQEALARLIDQLIDEYIDEIEKIASVVTNHEEFGDESTTPFEVGMTAEMLTVPLTSIAENHHKNGVWSFGRSVKDWMADRIATNVLMNRLDPQNSSDSSSSESDSEDEELGLVESITEPLVHAAATVSIVGKAETRVHLPKISIHEGTPDSCVTFGSVINRKGSLGVPPTKDSTPCTSRKSSTKKKRKSTLKHAVMNPFANYSQSTMRAIQAIETGKMRAYRNNDFKSRLFAKFATSDRLAKMGQSIEPKKMVSCSIQTTPVVSPIMQRPRNLRSAYGARINNPLIESMDSTSSEVGPSGDWTNASVFDVDSLCSVGYFDLSFGGYSTYSTDSVPRMLAESNTPQPTMKPQQVEQMRHRRFPIFSQGFVQKVVDETSGSSNSMPLPFPVSNARSKIHSIMSDARRVGSASPPIVQAELLPPGSAVGTTPRISLTDVDSLTQSLMGKSPSTPAPTPTPTTSPTGNVKHSGRHKPASPGVASQVPLLASIPLHHRALCSRRRFSANNCLPLPNESLANKESGEGSSTSSTSDFIGLTKCPSCHHFSSQISSPVHDLNNCPHHPSPANKPPTTKIYARNSIGEIDWETIRRVRDACGLLPSDFLVYHGESKCGKNGEENSTAEDSIKKNFLLDDFGYSQSNATHSSPTSSVLNSPFVTPKERTEAKKEKERIFNINNVVVEVVEEMLLKISALHDLPPNN